MTATASNRRVLLALTSHDQLGTTGKETGYYVPEAAHPWNVFRDAGIRVDFVSVAGGTPPPTGYNPDDDVQRAFVESPEIGAALQNTPRAVQLDPADYSAIYYVGGHGTMWDFPSDEALAVLAGEIYTAGGVVAAVCHGPAGLLTITLPDGAPLVDGKEVAAFTNEEESAVGLDGVVPFLLADELGRLGARHLPAPAFTPHVVVSERLVTGQNPASAAGVAEQVVKLLEGATAPVAVH